MTKTKSTKRALLSSGLALLLCVSMLIGSTFAWFTDTATTGVNTIQAGTLDVALEYLDGTEWKNAEGITLNFKKAADAPANEAILWEPGCTYEMPAIRVVNNGDLKLKYTVVITGINGDAKLNEAIEWTLPSAAASILEPNAESDSFTIKGHMKEDAGNEYQGLTIEGISITVYATQVKGEFDSFTNDYDEKAPLPGAIIDSTFYATLQDAIDAAAATDGGATVKLGADIALTEGIEIPEGATVGLDLNGHTVSMSVAATTTSALITNNGTLTIQDSGTNGKLTYESAILSDNYPTSTITNNGTLTVKSGTIENTSVGDSGASYAIDSSNTLTVEGGTITAGRIAIRQVQHGACDNTVTVTGGTISGGFAGLQVYVKSNANVTSTVIKDGTFEGDFAFYTYFYNVVDSSNTEIKIEDGIFDGAVYLYNGNYGSDAYPLNVTITGGNFLTEDVYVYTKDAQGGWVLGKSIQGGTFADVSALKYLAENANVTIKQAKDVALDETLTVPATATVVLDLNGKNITMESAAAVSMITNKGSLTINGTGKIAYTFTGTPGGTGGAGAYTIENRGVLVVNGGEISNTATNDGLQIGYGIDNYNGATLTVNDGKITATGSFSYDGIRLMCGNNDTTVTVNGGEISSIWAQNPSANKDRVVKGTVVINGGTVKTTYYENYTTVKVAEGVTATVTPYAAGSDNTTSAVVDGYTVYSFVH